MQIWTEAELECLRKNINKPSTKDIFDLFIEEFGDNSRTYDSVQKKVRQLRVAFSPDDTSTSPESDIDTQISELLAPQPGKEYTVSSELKREVRERKKEWLRDFLEQVKQYKGEDPVLAPVQGSGTSLVVQLSDIHIGQQNKYFNLEIAKQRLLGIPKSMHTLFGVHPIDEVVILLIGDIVDGEDIYPTQPHHILCTVMEQIPFAVECLMGVASGFRSLFDVPVRFICVPGNHGRVSHTASEKTNWDNFTYLLLRTAIASRGDEQLSIECDYDEFFGFQVKDKVGLINHQGVKHNGTPAMREKIAGWVFNKGCHFIASGHWHEWKVGSWQSVIVASNGSLCGPNDLSERIAQESPARQGYFLVTAGRPLWGFGFLEWENESFDE